MSNEYSKEIRVEIIKEIKKMLKSGELDKEDITKENFDATVMYVILSCQKDSKLYELAVEEGLLSDEEMNG